MIRSIGRAVAAAVLTAVGCTAPPVGPGGEPPTNPRLAMLERALSTVRTDPPAAARDLAAAGPGAALETLRLELWLEALEAYDAQPDAWRALVDANPPREVAVSAVLNLASAHRRAGDPEAADAVLLNAPAWMRREADLGLLQSVDPAVREAAARRLALTAPARLRAVDRTAEERALAGFAPDDWLERARAWRENGRAASAAAELRGLRWRGEVEQTRRRELGWAELEAGRPSRALALVGRARDADASLLRAFAFRRHGWSRVPDGAWRSAFADCNREAQRALDGLRATDDGTRAAELILECATEVSELEAAWRAWRVLHDRGWNGDRRDWLGRRLGVALARAGRWDRATELAAAVADHERCIRWWMARGRSDAVRGLVHEPVDDLYSRWAREDLGLPSPAPVSLAPDLDPAEPPPPVRWLLDVGHPRLAALEWRRHVDDHPPTPAEAIAAATLAESLGWRNDSIRWLRRGVPELGGLETLAAPGNAVRAYLPLGWGPALVAAAREEGVDPWLLAGVARQESTFLPDARSAAGAVGLMQLMPGTAAGHARALRIPRPVDLTDPETNLRLGARELAQLLERFGALEPALAAYNAGGSRARRWWRHWNDPRIFTESIPIPETYGYVRRVVYLADAYRHAYPDQWRKPS